jgi:hypothetical protein
MKKTLVLKTSKLFLPILIGIFVVSGTILSLPLLKSTENHNEIGHELSEGNPTETLSTNLRTHWTLPMVTIQSAINYVSVIKLEATNIIKRIIVSKDSFRNVLFARAP